MRFVNLGEGSINCSYNEKGSVVTGEQVREFSIPSKKQRFLKKLIPKKNGDQVPNCPPKQQMYLELVAIMKVILVNSVITGSMQHVWISQKQRMNFLRI